MQIDDFGKHTKHNACVSEEEYVTKKTSQGRDYC